MKAKHLIIVSLILAILTIGAVSASQDVAVSDELAADDIAEATIEEAAADDSTLGAESHVEGFDTDYKEVTPVNYIGEVISVENYGDPGEGNLTVAVNDAPVYDWEFMGDISFDLDDLAISSPDEYNILVSFVPKTGSALTLANYTLIVTENETDIGIFSDISAYVDVSDEDSYLAYYSTNNDTLNGNIILYIDNEVYYNETITDSCNIHMGDLKKVLSLGTYLVQMKYYDGENLTLIQSELTKFDFDIGIEEFEYGTDTLAIGPDALLEVFLPKDATGSLYVVLNGIEYKATYKNGYGNVTIPTQNLDVSKDYNITLVLRNDPKYPGTNTTYEITTIPTLNYPDVMSIAETETASIWLPGKYSGTLRLYNSKWDEDEGEYVKDGNPIATASVVNGKASLKFKSSKVGFLDLILEYENGYYVYSRSFDVEVINNTNGIAATVKPTTISSGESVTVTLTGPKDLNKNFYIYVDGVEQDKPLNFFNLGSISQSIKLTTVGEHAIKILGSDEYSNTFYVTVNKASTAPAKKADVIKLTLKKVSVKKSAKKLVLQATLKINGKAVKGKVIKFKFKGKTYKAKTNKKGAAKVTIKKKVLKKLKKGKKVTYQATYGKVTKKYTVKVKK